MTKPCAVCGRDVIGDVIGVQWSIDNTKIIACVHNCPCGDTRYAPWADAPESIRHEAVIAEQLRLRMEGLA